MTVKILFPCGHVNDYPVAYNFLIHCKTCNMGFTEKQIIEYQEK